MQCAQNEVTGFGRAQRDLDGVTIAHFADKNDLGGLAQGRAQTVSKIIKIGPEFALVESGFGMRVNEFDRIFESDDMDRLGLIDLMKNRSQHR